LIDDIDFSGLGTAGTLYDIDQVDVLRGPQADPLRRECAGGTDLSAQRRAHGHASTAASISTAAITARSRRAPSSADPIDALDSGFGWRRSTTTPTATITICI
jgi:outer membrane receptor for monomeric catechols